MAAFDFGALLSGATQGLAGYRRGQLKGEDVHREREEAERVQLFNEFAKRRQLDIEAQKANDMNEYRTGQNETRAQQVAIQQELANLKGEVARQGSYRDQNQVGPNGTERERIAAMLEAANARNAAMLEGAMIRAGATTDAARIRAESQGSRLKPVPAAILNGYQHNNQQLRVIDETIKQLQANPDAVGFHAAIPSILLNRVEGKRGAGGTAARAGIADVGSLEIRGRSGQAVTQGEFERLKPHIPHNTDNAKTAIEKLGRLRAAVAQMTAEMADFYTPEQGYMGMPGPSRRTGAPWEQAGQPGQPPAASPAAPPSGDGLDDHRAWLARRRAGRKP